MEILNKVMPMAVGTEQQIINGLNMALGTVPNFLLTISAKFISPIICAIMVIILLVTFGRAGFSSSRMKETFETHMYSIILEIIIIVVSGSFSLWGWTMLGMASA